MSGRHEVVTMKDVIVVAARHGTKSLPLLNSQCMLLQDKITFKGWLRGYDTSNSRQSQEI